MVKTRFRIQDIKSYSPALDIRNSDSVYVIDGRNYYFTSKGPKSGFGTRLLAAGEVIGDPIGIAQSIEIANRSLLFVRKGIYELDDQNTQWNQIFDLTTYQDIPFLPEKKWSAAYLSNGVYFCHINHGLLKLTFDGFVELNQDTTPGLPFEPLAIVETNGRLVVLGRKYVGWSGPSAAEDFQPALGGAGEVLLSDRVPGTPVALASFQGGFLVWTDQGCLLAEFIGGDNVFRFTRVTTDQIPLDANCIETFPDGSQVICTKQGLYQIKNGGEPTKLVPIFSEFLRTVLEHETAIHIRLTYMPEEDLLFVQVRDWTNHYVRTYVLSVALDKWGQFSERHLGIIKWAPERGAFGYVDLAGVGHKFIDVFNREVTPHVFEGLDSRIRIGQIKPPELHGEIDSLLEMQEIFLGGKARPSWSQPAEIDLGVVPPPVYSCESLNDTPEIILQPSMTPDQLTNIYDTVNDGTGTIKSYWDDISFHFVNLDTGKVYQYTNRSGDYAEPDYTLGRTYLNEFDSTGADTVKYWPGTFGDSISDTHYLVHDGVNYIDRYTGNSWAIHDFWLTAGSTLICAQNTGNDFIFTEGVLDTLHDLDNSERRRGSGDLQLDSFNFVIEQYVIGGVEQIIGDNISDVTQITLGEGLFIPATVAGPVTLTGNLFALFEDDGWVVTIEFETTSTGGAESTTLLEFSRAGVEPSFMTLSRVVDGSNNVSYTLIDTADGLINITIAGAFPLAGLTRVALNWTTTSVALTVNGSDVVRDFYGTIGSRAWSSIRIGGDIDAKDYTVKSIVVVDDLNNDTYLKGWSKGFDEGLGQVNNIVGFTETKVIIVHEVFGLYDFKLTSIDKETLAEHKSAYIHTGYNNVNRSGPDPSWWGGVNFCMGPDGNVYFGAQQQDATPTYPNGTNYALMRFNPETGAYDDVTPWSSENLPLVPRDGEVFTDEGVHLKLIWYDRKLNKICALFGGRIGPFFLLNTRYRWSIGMYDIETQSWEVNMDLPSMDWMDENHVNTTASASTWVSTGMAVINIDSINKDALPLSAPCMGYLRTFEGKWAAHSGEPAFTTGLNDPAEFGMDLVIRDPSQGFAVVERFTDFSTRYDSLNTAYFITNQFLRNFALHKNLNGADEFGLTNFPSPVIYLPDRTYLNWASGITSDYIFSIHPYGPTWNDDNSRFWMFLKP